MNTTLQPRRTAPPALPATVQPQRGLQVKGISTPIRVVWSTPRQLWAFLAAIVCSSCLFYLASARAISRSREAIHSVAEECAPSIVAAQQIRSALADFDANLENVLLCGPMAGDAAVARAAADARHREIASTLVVAAQNITFGAAEKIPITTIVGVFATFDSLMARAWTLEEKGDSSGAFGASREANRLLDEVLLPAAESLDKANRDVLDRTYARQKFDAQEAIAILVFCGILTVGALVAAQIFLFRKMHRILNPALLCATLLAAFQLGGAATRNIRAASLLRVAVDDAFASVHLISRARAIAYGANGEESRWLYDRERAIEHWNAFSADANGLARIPPGWSAETIASAVRSAERDAAVSAALPPGFTGLLADELRNLTFPGEREAAAEALQAFDAYLAVDRTIRSHERAGRHDAAVRLCLSFEEGGSNRLFEKFDHALGAVLQINQRAFESAKADSFRALAGGETTVAVTTLLTIACALAGFWPRLREYRA